MPETKELSIIIPVELHEALTAEATRQGQTLAAYTRALLWERFSKGEANGLQRESRVSEPNGNQEPDRKPE